jgi:hypothetical protein
MRGLFDHDELTSYGWKLKRELKRVANLRKQIWMVGLVFFNLFGIAQEKLPKVSAVVSLRPTVSERSTRRQKVRPRYHFWISPNEPEEEHLDDGEFSPEHSLGRDCFGFTIPCDGSPFANCGTHGNIDGTPAAEYVAWMLGTSRCNLPKVNTGLSAIVNTRERVEQLPFSPDFARPGSRDAIGNEAVGGYNSKAISSDSHHLGREGHPRLHGRDTENYANYPKYIRRTAVRGAITRFYSAKTGDSYESIADQDIDISVDGKEWFHMLGAYCMKGLHPLPIIISPLLVSDPKQHR